ncbi:MAG TPA: helix-turn-helix transcriptional regulator [Castellaniella sp.]|nr:helix-turn-helix transcriptional regulator [Castellaniella sp.]
MKHLTAREQECLQWAAQGKTSWEIGRILNITERTVNFHIANTCEKLQVRTRQAAITMALQGNLISVRSASFSRLARNPVGAPASTVALQRSL